MGASLKYDIYHAYVTKQNLEGIILDAKSFVRRSRRYFILRYTYFTHRRG